jgi:cytoskeletal protein RodZ
MPPAPDSPEVSASEASEAAPSEGKKGSRRKGLLWALLVLVLLAVVLLGALAWMKWGQNTVAPATTPPVPVAEPAVSPEAGAAEEAPPVTGSPAPQEGEDGAESGDAEAGEAPAVTGTGSAGGLDIDKIVEERVAKQREELQEELKKQYEAERKRLEEELEKTRDQESASPPPEGGDAAPEGD